MGQEHRTFFFIRQALYDATLASECYFFLPEMCMENAFPQMSYAESIRLVSGNDGTTVCYNNQLAEYRPLHTNDFGVTAVPSKSG